MNSVKVKARQRIGVGFVGLSAKRGWASLAHLPALRALPEFEVRALSASSPESARLAAEAHGVPVACSDYRELVARPDVDLVVVTVKVPDHFDIVAASIEAGKNVFCEWPLGNGLAEAEELARLASERKIRSFVGLQARSAPPIRFLRDLVAEGAIGEVLSTSVLGSASNWGPVIAPAYEYSVDRSNGATMLSIPFGHTADGLAFTLGEFSDVNATMTTRRPLVRAAATGEDLKVTVDDQIVVSGTLSGGAVYSMHYRGGMSTGTNFLWEINGTAGDIVLRGENGHLQYGRVTIEMTAASGDLEPRPVPRRYMATDTDPASRANSVAEAYTQIANDLVEGRTDSPTFDDAVRRHRMLETVSESASTGRRLQFQPDEVSTRLSAASKRSADIA